MSASSSSSSSSFSPHLPSRTHGTMPQQAHKMPGFFTFKDAINLLMRMRIKTTPPSEKRLIKLRTLNIAIKSDNFLSDSSETLRKVSLLFKQFYLQKNASPELDQRIALGYPIQETQKIDDLTDYHREQDGRFWKEAIQKLFPDAEFRLEYSYVFLVKHRELIFDLTVHHKLSIVESSEEVSGKIENLVHEIRYAPSKENIIYVMVKLDTEEKKTEKDTQLASIVKKRDEILKLLEPHKQTYSNTKFPPLFSVICLLEISEEISLIAFDDHSFRSIIKSGSYAPTMIELQQQMINISMSSQVALDRAASIPPPPILTPDKFLNGESYQKYKALGLTFNPSDSEKAEIIPILASANQKMIESLIFSMQKKDILDDETTMYLASECLKRLELLFEKSVEHQDISVKYFMLHELIAEELLLLLNLTKPYSEDNFNQIVSDLAASNSYEIPSLARPFSSGVAAFNASMSAVSKSINAPPKMIISSSSYYELEETSSFKAAKNELLSNFRCYRFNAQRLDKSLKSILDLRFNPDVLALSIRSCPTSKGPIYSDSEKIKKFLNSIHLNLPEGHHMTVILDVTNDTLNSEEITNFVNSFTNSILNEELSFILFRSGHKFLQFGVDKINAGYAELFSMNETLKQNFMNLPGTLKGLDYQGLCHLMACASSEIDAYTELHCENNQHIYNYLSSHIGEGVRNGIKLYPSLDPKSYYFQIFPVTTIKLDHHEWRDYPEPKEELALVLAETIIRLAIREGIPVIRRDSFGYNETVICDIGDTLRISVGSHTQEQMDRLCEIIMDCHDTIQRFSSPESRPKRMRTLKEIILKRPAKSPSRVLPITSTPEQEQERPHNEPFFNDLDSLRTQSLYDSTSSSPFTRLINALKSL